MSESKHTPPPWYVENLTVWSANGKVLESPSGDIDQIEADLQLASAAPELLATLEYILNEHLSDCYPECPYCRAGYAAIAKAKEE